MKSIIDSILPQIRKPARYIGNELNSIHKDWEPVRLRVLLAYPDLYEVGMSNLGIQILYHILNLKDDVLAERVFAPAQDMEEKLKENNIPLFSLESWTPADKFDLIGFSLGHELTYTNLLNMLALSKIPLRSKDRTNDHPLVFAGGPCAMNPSPIEDFIDFFVIGEGEEVILEIAELIAGMKSENKDLKLEKLSKTPGIYVPSIGNKTTKRYVKDFNSVPYPTKPIVPFISAIHDRAVVEIMRGCKHMCKFCSACIGYNPVRMKKPEKVIELALEILKNTGYEDLSLISLSSSDYTQIEEVAKFLAKKIEPNKVSLSLPSLRLDSFSLKLAKEIQRVRPTSVTMAPEAGTQRLRDVVGKKLSKQDIIEGARAAFSEGITNLKLYFMIGLPTETFTDIEAIAELARKVSGIGREYSQRAHVTASVSTFIPKPHTPFERERQISLEEIIERQKYLKQNLKGRGLELRWHDAKTSILEGAFSRGDKKLSEVIEKAYLLGARFDAWSEYFKFEIWEQAFNECGSSMNSYLEEIDEKKELPWAKITLR
ncbi:MAG: radical SAM protein [Candidatus Saganbacteria bacterium]|uniref:Radical SAM protein n=1 Tax=Candidatus Saganbacteria bacterium TaxID=2575572 RepID=A0A833L1F6_UNCSA|nr:MAG: radical SAM protein [Candidatus Saganbacteria bacterium]